MSSGMTTCKVDSAVKTVVKPADSPADIVDKSSGICFDLPMLSDLAPGLAHLPEVIRLRTQQMQRLSSQ